MSDFQKNRGLEMNLTEDQERSYKRTFKRLYIKRFLKLLLLLPIIIGIKPYLKEWDVIISFVTITIIIVLLCVLIIESETEYDLSVLKMNDFIKREIKKGTVFRIKERVIDNAMSYKRYYEIIGELPEKFEGIPHIDFRGIKLFSREHIEEHSAITFFDWRSVDYYELEKCMLSIDETIKENEELEFIYFKMHTQNEKKDPFEIELLKEEWICSSYQWKLEMTDGFEAHEKELKTFRVEYEEAKSK